MGAKKDKSKPPVLCLHSLVLDMMIYVIHEPKVAPAFVMANQGYDVWLGNNRGNKYSDKHTTLDPKSKEYWMFDWEDMGTKDVPAMIEFIVQQTGH